MGVALTLPTLEELYSQLEQFLRPAVDSAIDNRREHGETTLAELDADAYSRGMGGSTYLSGMKRREYDAVAADIAMLEANYNAQLAKYLYEATQELAGIQQSFAEMQLRHRQDMQKLRAQQAGRGSGNGKSGGQGGNGNGKGKSGSSGGGSYPEGSGKYYNYYCAYLSHLSAQNLDNVFLQQFFRMDGNKRTDAAKARKRAVRADYEPLCSARQMRGGFNERNKFYQAI